MRFVFRIFFISLLCKNTAFGEEYFLQKIWVSKENIIRRIYTSTLTSCHLKCQTTKGCTTIALERRQFNTESSDACYLLKKVSASKKKNDFTPLYGLTNHIVKDEECIDGGYSEWLEFGSCTQNCGSGIQTRKRLCDNPKPQGGGRTCQENAAETRTCNTHACPSTYCAIALASGNDTVELTLEGLTEIVTCKRIGNHNYTVFSHSAEVMHAYSKDDYSYDNILYLNNTSIFIHNVVLQSKYCIQRFHFKCRANAPSNCYFKGFNSQMIPFTHSDCKGCDAVVNNNIEVDGSAYIEDKLWFPPVGMHFRDNDNINEYMNITLDKLICR